MQFDGYSTFDAERLEQFKTYSTAQTQINARLKEIAREMNALPKMPASIDKWIDSYPDLTTKSFGIDTYTKHMQISKEYDHLIDESESNLRELKLIFVDDLLAKINGILSRD